MAEIRMKPVLKTTLQVLKPDPRNANRHSEYGTGLLENSTRINGFGRSVLVSSDNVVIAGNGVVEAAASIGMEKIDIIETDGTSLVVVKRTDIKSGTPEFYNMALADNITALKNIVLNPDVVEGIVLEHPETKFWGNIVAEEKEVGSVDKTTAGETEMTFKMTGAQAARINQALKLAKGKLKGNKTNTAALVLIAKQFLAQSK